MGFSLWCSTGSETINIKYLGLTHAFENWLDSKVKTIYDLKLRAYNVQFNFS